MTAELMTVYQQETLAFTRNLDGMTLHWWPSSYRCPQCNMWSDFGVTCM